MECELKNVKNPILEIDTREILDWQSFHAVFAEGLGFPHFYGQNMNAWVDCLTEIDNPEAKMTKITVPSGRLLVLQLQHANDFAQRCPEIFQAMIESLAFVNWRRIEQGDEPILTISFFD